MTKIIHLNYSDINGGAARAAYRIHHAIRNIGIDSSMIVDVAASGDWTVNAPSNNFDKAIKRARPFASQLLMRLMRTENKIMHSPSIIPSNRLNAINKSNADLVHLHWVQGEMLTIAEIGRIKKPVVWTLHDMWAFCGAEHLAWDDRWREGYDRNNRPLHESGFDLNRWTWIRKRKHWQRPFHIVTPSRWLAECVNSSMLMRNWPVTVIPNCLNTEVWKPIDKELARVLLGLPLDIPLIMFGSNGANSAHHKGFDLLIEALNKVGNHIKNLRLVVFGELEPRIPLELPFPVTYVGHLHDDLSLRILYSSVDVLVVPSRQEAFGQTASEAHACGTPVVAFNATGLKDIVQHKKTGYLAEAFDTDDLSFGIRWLLDDKIRLKALGNAARQYVVDNFSNQLVAARYKQVYEESMHASSITRV